MPKSIVTDHEILEAALIGLQHSLASVDAKIKEIRRQVGGKPARNAAAPVSSGPATTKRTMSASARKRIASAQKKRWAAYHKAQQK
jgi:hypothetical protein